MRKLSRGIPQSCSVFLVESWIFLAGTRALASEIEAERSTSEESLNPVILPFLNPGIVAIP